MGPDHRAAGEVGHEGEFGRATSGGSAAGRVEPDRAAGGGEFDHGVRSSNAASNAAGGREGQEAGSGSTAPGGSEALVGVGRVASGQVVGQDEVLHRAEPSTDATDRSVPPSGAGQVRPSQTAGKGKAGHEASPDAATTSGPEASGGGGRVAPSQAAGEDEVGNEAGRGNAAIDGSVTSIKIGRVDPGQGAEEGEIGHEGGPGSAAFNSGALIGVGKVDAGQAVGEGKTGHDTGSDSASADGSVASIGVRRVEPGQAAGEVAAGHEAGSGSAVVDGARASIRVVQVAPGQEGEVGHENGLSKAASDGLVDSVEGGRSGSGRGKLSPVLWSESSGRGLAEVPHWSVAGGRLHLALAVVAVTARGTVEVFHVTHRQVGEYSFDVLMAEACHDLGAGLRVVARDTPEGRLFSVSGTLVAAAACLPEFYRLVSQVAGAERLVVGLPSPDEILVAPAGSGVVDVVHRAVWESGCPAGGELVPSVLSVVGDRIEVVAERG